MQTLMWKAEVAILIPDKMTSNKNPRVKEWHYMMIKGSIHQEDITNLNVYAPNKRVLKYIK